MGDDTVLMAAVSQPEDIIHAANVITSTAFTQLRRVGFTPNCKKGRSQIMPVIIGKQAVAVKRKLFVEGDPKLEVSDEFSNRSIVHIGLDYKHLGNHNNAKRSSAKDILLCIAEASNASRELCRSATDSGDSGCTNTAASG